MIVPVTLVIMASAKMASTAMIVFANLALQASLSGIKTTSFMEQIMISNWKY